MIFVSKEGKRFCRDRKWRSHAPFGTMSNCLKIYKSMAWAKKTANKYRANVIVLPSDVEMCASGKIIRRLPSKHQGFETVKEISEQEFVFA